MRVYVAPKDPPAPAQPVAAKPVEWQLPDGWAELPDQGPGQFGRFASIQVSKDDPSLVLAVNVLDGAGSGDLLPNLNRWEGQLGLPPSSQAEAAAKAKTIEVDGHAGQRVDLTGVDPKTNTPARMLAFLLPHGQQAWSFKLQGAPDHIAAQEAAFDAFILSVRFTSHDHGPADAVAGPGTAKPSPDTAPVDNKTYTLKGFKTPPGWVQDPAQRQMRVMTFNVGPDNERAELIVTKFGVNRFGSILDNVNRWRGEVGLPPTGDVTQENFRELKLPGGSSGIVFDFAAPRSDPAAGGKRSYVAMLRQGGEVWFVKLLGPAKTVIEQRENFDAFLQSFEFGEAGE